jgi:hypothetical protein
MEWLHNLPLQEVQLCCMRDVVTGGLEAYLRHIFRWYSREFSTPLHQVEALPLEDVLRHFFEDKYENMEEHDRDEEIKRLLIDPEKLANMRRDEDAQDAEAWEFGKLAEAEETAKKAIKAIKPETVETTSVSEVSSPRNVSSPAIENPLPEDVNIIFEELDALGPPG